MKNIFVAALFLVVSAPAMAFAPVGDFKTDFYEGWIEIEPVVPIVRNGYIITGKSECIGLCFSKFFGGSIGFGGKTNFKFSEGKKQLENAYFFLSGNPDDLIFYYITFACGPKGHLYQVTHIQHKFVVFKGEFQVRGLFASNREIIANVIPGWMPQMVQEFPGFEAYLRRETFVTDQYPASKPQDFVSYACTDEFRQRWQGHAIINLAPQFGDYFLVQWDGTNITIAWDTTTWTDEVDQEAKRALIESRRVMAEHGVLLPAIQEPTVKIERNSRYQKIKRLQQQNKSDDQGTGEQQDDPWFNDENYQ